MYLRSTAGRHGQHAALLLYVVDMLCTEDRADEVEVPGPNAVLNVDVGKLCPARLNVDVGKLCPAR